MAHMKEKLNDVMALTERLQRDFPAETSGFLNF